MVIMVDAIPFDPLRSFQIVVARVEETAMGILVYSLVSAFLWPRSSRGALYEASHTLSATQHQLYRTYRGLMAGQGTAEESQPLRMREVHLLTGLGQALNAAETDSYEVWEVRHQWRRFHEQAMTLGEALESWRESFPEVQPLDLTKLLPNIEAVLLELDDRFAEIERMLMDEAPTRKPKPVSLVVEHKETLTHTHFQRAALAVTKTQLDRLETLSRSLFDCVQDIKGFASQRGPSRRIEGRPHGLALDPDRFAGALLRGSFSALFSQESCMSLSCRTFQATSSLV